MKTNDASLPSDAPVRVGRPKSEQKRVAILDASAHLFLKNGFKDTSMDAVAAAAGVSKQTVYSHFNGKDALLRACVEEKVREYGLQAEDLPRQRPLRDALCEIGAHFVDLINDEDVIRMYRLLVSESVAHPALSRAFYDSGPRPTRDVVAHFLAEHEQGGARFDNEQFAAERFFAMLEHINLMDRLLNLAAPMSAEERAAHTHATVDAFLRIYPPLALSKLT